MVIEESRVYSVGEVADMLGVHWRTLHNWEQAGLVRPARAGGRRIYGAGDVRLLRRVLHLTRHERFGPKAVAEIIRLERRVDQLEWQVQTGIGFEIDLRQPVQFT